MCHNCEKNQTKFILTSLKIGGATLCATIINRFFMKNDTIEDGLFLAAAGNLAYYGYNFYNYLTCGKHEDINENHKDIDEKHKDIDENIKNE